MQHVIWEHGPSWAWDGSGRWQKGELLLQRVPSFLNPSFLGIFLFTLKEQREAQLWYLRTYQTVFAQGIKPFPLGECGKKRKVWRLLSCQDSAPSHHVASSCSQRLKRFDATFFTSPEVCAVPDETVTASMSPSPH